MRISMFLLVLVQKLYIEMVRVKNFKIYVEGVSSFAIFRLREVLRELQMCLQLINK
jgi:hypothetical protein